MDSKSGSDPVERRYDRRIRGVCLISAAAGRRMHLHAGCWVTAAGDDPPRVAVSIPREFEGAALALESGVLAVSVLARDQAALVDALFSGRHSLGDLGRTAFLLTRRGCAVPERALGYLELELAHHREFEDALLVVGDVRGGALLREVEPSLTVNEIQAAGRVRRAVLPRLGFEDAGDSLRRAPVEHPAHGVLGRVLGRRSFGPMLLTAGRGDDLVRVETRIIQCSHAPPRMLVALPHDSPALARIRSGRGFALSLVGADQRPWLMERMRGERADTGAWPRSRGGFALLPGAIAHFAVEVEGELGGGDPSVVVYGHVTQWDWVRPDAPPMASWPGSF